MPGCFRGGGRIKRKIQPIKQEKQRPKQDWETMKYYFYRLNDVRKNRQIEGYQ